MTTRRPLILISGSLSELPQGDTVAGVTLGLVSSPSGLYSDPNGDFGYDGTAEALALAALASGTAAQSTANTALVSGTAAQSTANTALVSGTAAQSTANTALASGIAAQATADSAAKLDAVQTFTAVQTLTSPEIIGTIKEDVYVIPDAAAFEVAPASGSVQLITLGASRTPKATTFAAGESVTLMVDDGSSYALTWTDATWGSGVATPVSGVAWTGGEAPSLAPSGYTVLQFWKVGTQVYGALVGEVA
jgi:hypothetical protein